MDKLKTLIIFLALTFSFKLGANSYYTHRIKFIKECIKVLSPKISDKKLNMLSRSIYSEGEKYLIDYRIFIIILFIESGFNQDSKSNTGDFSIAQINLSEWKKPENRKRLTKSGNKIELITQHETFAIEIMAEILHLLYKERALNDPRWYATYHSKTKQYKENYIKKIDATYNRIKHIEFK